jgi:PAS domain S-box-containing protein
VSPSYAAWQGLRPEEIANRPIVDVAGPEAYETGLPHMEKVLSGEREEFETQVNYRGAGLRWVHAVYVPTRGNDHEVDGWIGVVTDVTERHEAAERLRESEERFRNMADTAPVMISVSGPDKLCTFFNQVWLDFRGRALEQELGNGWAEGVHPDDLDRTLAIYSSSFDARQRFQLEYRLRRADGKYRWLLGSGVPRFTAGGVFQGYIGSSIDVTDFKKAQERFRLVVEASPAAMVMVDGEGKIVLVNSRTEKLFGYGRQELAGQPVEILVPESLRDTHQTLRNEYLLQPIARPMGKGLDLSGRRKDGTQFPVEIGLAPIETEDGSCVLSSIVDISERKLAEERLRESEERFRAAFFQAAVGMSETTIDGHWLLLNDRLCEILGYSRDELLGKSFYDITHPEDRWASRVAVRRLLAGEISSSLIEKRYIRKNGVPVWVRVFMSLVRGLHNEAFLVRVVDDINERRQAQEKLRESEERFRNMADTAPVMIWTSGPDKRCTFLNKVWLDFTGRTLEQELGYGWTEGVHPDDLERFWAVYSSAFDARQSFHMDGRLRRADGAYRWLMAHGVPRFTADNDFQGYIGSCIDLTERIRAEEERQKFVLLADSSLEFIGFCDLDFRPLYINPAGLRLVGLDNLEAAYQATVQDFFFPEDQPFITNEFFPRVLRDGHGKVEIRFRHFKTGEAMSMICYLYNMRDARGADVGWATVSVDITERKQAELALQESRQELRALAGRLINAEEQERKRISRELHDDLNQKLACLAFDADSLRLMPFSSEDKIREQLLNHRTRIVELSQHVREISHRLHPSILDDLGLIAALEELSQEFSTRERVEVQFTQEAVPPAIPADVAACLYRVAQEAIHNVLKHARADYVRMSLSGDSRGIHLSIHDTGVGFDSEAGLRRPGLGIVSMKERVLLVHGEFSIHSQPGQGTEVRVFVPLTKEALLAA